MKLIKKLKVLKFLKQSISADYKSSRLLKALLNREKHTCETRYSKYSKSRNVSDTHTVLDD